MDINPPGISGSGLGKKQQTSSYQPTPDTGFSNSQAIMVEVISEGEIEGVLANEQGVFLEGTPVNNVNGSSNFKGVQIAFRNGTQDQEILPGLTEQASEQQVGVKVTSSILQVVRQIINPYLDTIRLTFQVRLFTTQQNTGAVATSLRYQVWIKEGSAPYVLRRDETLQGKFTNPVNIQRSFDVNNVNGTVDTFLVKIIKITPDPGDDNTATDLFWQSYTEVTKEKVNYSNVAVVGEIFDSANFSSIPQRSYLTAGVKLKIPTNATVNLSDRGLDFVGNWDGRLYETNLACSDPAWQILYLFNDLSGVGDYFPVSRVNISDLYQMSRYNNEMIPDGKGGFERRFQCNTTLQTREKVIKHLDNFCSAMNAKWFTYGGELRFWQDRPGEIEGQFTNSDVENGDFIYGRAGIRSKFTLVNVHYNDPANDYKQIPEPVEDPIGIVDPRLGVRILDMVRFGCTRRSEAIRAGKWAIESNKASNKTVVFKPRAIAWFLMPGKLINIFDSRRKRIRYNGLIAGATINTVTLDAPVSIIETGATISVLLPDGSIETRGITNPPGAYTTISVAPNFSDIPGVEANWIIQTPKFKAEPYRIVGVTPDIQDPTKLEVSAILHDPTKYDRIEKGLVVAEETEFRPLATPVTVDPPLLASLKATHSSSGFRLLGQWILPSNPFIKAARIELSRDGIVWTDSRNVFDANVFDYGIVPTGYYWFRVASTDVFGRLSTYVNSQKPLYITRINMVQSLAGAFSSTWD